MPNIISSLIPLPPVRGAWRRPACSFPTPVTPQNKSPAPTSGETRGENREPDSTIHPGKKPCDRHKGGYRNAGVILKPCQIRTALTHNTLPLDSAARSKRAHAAIARMPKQVATKFRSPRHAALVELRPQLVERCRPRVAARTAERVPVPLFNVDAVLHCSPQYIL